VINREDIEARISRISLTLGTLQAAWPHLTAEIGARIERHTQRLVAENDEQTRGRIKALADLLNLPETLNQERESLTAALSEQSDAAL
jgi:hypothetical protein